jgi:hypothetical protein
MNQFVKIWRGSLPRLAFAGLLAAASLGAQAQIAGGGGFGGGGFIPGPSQPPVVVPVLPADANTLTWSKKASQAYALDQFTGNFYDQRPTISVTSITGTVSSYKAYAKTLAPGFITRDSLGSVTGQTIGDTLSWVAQNNPDVNMTGGIFYLSDISWTLNQDGSAYVWATASGTGIADTKLRVFSVTAASVNRNTDYTSFSSLAMSAEAVELMRQAFGASPDGLAYTALFASANDMGKMTLAVVPEASTWAQLSLGLVGIACLRRRQAARASAQA